MFKLMSLCSDTGPETSQFVTLLCNRTFVTNGEDISGLVAE